MTKEKINNKISCELKNEGDLKAKLRFLKNKPFQREKYLDKFRAKECKDIMELRSGRCKRCLD